MMKMLSEKKAIRLLIKNGYLLSFKTPIDYSNAKSVYIYFGIIIIFSFLLLFFNLPTLA